MCSDCNCNKNGWRRLISKAAVILLVLGGMALFSSCEDDPILEQKQKSAGGSYGKIFFNDSLENLGNGENPEVF